MVFRRVPPLQDRWQSSYASEKPPPGSCAIDILSIPAWFFVSLRDFGPSADANSVTMEAFVKALAATEQTPAEIFHSLDVSVLILVVFEERRPCRFSSGAAARGFIFGSADRNDDVEAKNETVVISKQRTWVWKLKCDSAVWLHRSASASGLFFLLIKVSTTRFQTRAAKLQTKSILFVSWHAVRT